MHGHARVVLRLNDTHRHLHNSPYTLETKSVCMEGLKDRRAMRQATSTDNNTYVRVRATSSSSCITHSGLTWPGHGGDVRCDDDRPTHIRCEYGPSVVFHTLQ
jgi:hypothetical protein